MPRADDEGHAVRIKALRAGPVSEINAFLIDIGDAYNALYWFNGSAASIGRAGRYGALYPLSSPFLTYGLGRPEQILPDDQLQLNRVSILSPGFWEFIGAINPIQQLRLWLNDRHERRKDLTYREAAERKRLRLDNEALRHSIFHSQLETIREFAGADAAEQALWSQLGPSLARLGRHQDSGLIEAELKGDDEEDNRPKSDDRPRKPYGAREVDLD